MLSQQLKSVGVFPIQWNLEKSVYIRYNYSPHYFSLSLYYCIDHGEKLF